MWEGRALASLGKADIDELIELGVREGRDLDYKQGPPAHSKAPDKRSDFVADVAAMANGSGGHLIYGVAEPDDASGVPGQVEGLADVDLDAEERRLRQILDIGLDPRLPPGQVEFHKIIGFPEGCVLVVRIRKSWAGPHMVRAEGRHRNAHYVRDGAMNRLLDARGLREAILAAGDVSRRVRAFRDDRLARIDAAETPTILAGRARLVAHVVPVATFDGPPIVDPAAVAERLYQDQRPLPLYGTLQGSYARPNIDGLVVLCNHDPKTGTHDGYVQVFRAGAIESVDALMLGLGLGGKGVIPTAVIEREVLKQGKGYLDFLTHHNVEPPYAFFLSLLGVRGASHEVSNWLPPARPPRTFDRDVVRLNEVLVDRDDLARPFESVLKPMFDELWQAGGYDKCPGYAADGTYDQRRGR